MHGFKLVYACRITARRIRETRWQHDGLDVATPTDGMGDGYTDTIDTNRIEQQQFNVSTEERPGRHALSHFIC